MHFLAVVGALAVTTVHSFKIGIIADLHLNPNYHPTVSAATYCEIKEGFSKDVLAHLSRHGCDPSFELVDVMLQHFRYTFASPYILLVVGDHVGHSTYDFDEKMETLRITSQLINNYFGDTPVLFQIGNNDTRDHD
jgi:hypothetical protein